MGRAASQGVFAGQIQALGSAVQILPGWLAAAETIPAGTSLAAHSFVAALCSLRWSVFNQQRGRETSWKQEDLPALKGRGLPPQNQNRVRN